MYKNNLAEKLINFFENFINYDFCHELNLGETKEEKIETLAILLPISGIIESIICELEYLIDNKLICEKNTEIANELLLESRLYMCNIKLLKLNEEREKLFNEPPKGIFLFMGDDYMQFMINKPSKTYINPLELFDDTEDDF